MINTQKIFAHLLHSAHSVETRNIVLNFCERNPNAKFLDCGCHDGEIAIELAKRIGTNEIWGIEVVEEYAAKAREKGVKVVMADLNEPFPFENRSFDAVHAANIIEHLSNTDMFLKEIYRILKVGGYFIVSTCNLAAFHNIFFLLLGRQPPPAEVSDEFQGVGFWKTAKKRGNPASPSHRRIFTLRALEGLLKCHGFIIEKSKGAGFYPLPIKLAKLMCHLDKSHSAYVVVKARKEG